MPSEKRARQRALRDKRRSRQRRREQLIGLRRRTVTILTVIAIGVALFLLFRTIGSDPNPVEEASGQPVACDGERPEPVTPMSFTQPEDIGLSPTAAVRATLVTSCGDVTIEIDQAASPATANSFMFLAEQGFYEGTLFHRVVEGFMVQGGDPTGTGTGGPGYRVQDEFPEEGFSYEEGVVAMANAGPGTTGSQFFIVSGPDAAQLSATFNVLGRVVSGMEAVQLISEVDVVPDARGEVSKPRESVFIEDVSVEVVEPTG